MNEGSHNKTDLLLSINTLTIVIIVFLIIITVLIAIIGYLSYRLLEIDDKIQDINEFLEDFEPPTLWPR
jgi:hypothetical protein